MNEYRVTKIVEARTFQDACSKVGDGKIVAIEMESEEKERPGFKLEFNEE